MADPLSLALGIVPLCITAIKIMTPLFRKLKTLCRYGKEVKTFRKRLRVQGDIFRDELHLLLLEILDREIVSEMMRDESHPQWQAQDLEAKVEGYLDVKYNSFQETISEAREIMKDLLDSLASLTPSDAEEVPISKATLRAFHVTFRGKAYDESLQTLKESNAELRRIRKVAGKMEVYRTKVDCLPLPSGYKINQDMSSFLYGLLQNQFSCEEDTWHDAMLLLGSMDEKDPIMNVFIEHKSNVQRVLLAAHAYCSDTSYDRSGLLTPDSSHRADHTPKRRCVRDTRNNRRSETTQHTNTYANDIDERHSLNLSKDNLNCQRLFSGLSAAHTGPRLPLGYADNNHGRRVVLCSGLQGLKSNFNDLKTRCAISLVEFLKPPAYNVISDEGRIKLGIILVKSMLKYNSTPWWPQDWTLGQVCVFHKSQFDLCSSFDTLHVSVHLEATSSNRRGVNPALTPLDEEDYRPDSLPLESLRYAMDNHGIRNITLYGLGVALLQIGLWQPVAWEDHVQVRRKAEALNCFGRRYRNAVKRLIHCDFGLATEQLEDAQLQSAIFNGVVGDLESLLHALA